MSEPEREGPMKDGTNSFYCSDEELIEAVNELLDGTDQYRSMSHFVASCVRSEVESETDSDERGVIDVKIEKKELAEYVAKKHEKGEFFNQQHVVIVALERMRKDDKGQMLV